LATSFVLIFHFENSHYINITLVFKAKTKNKIINPKTSIYLLTVPNKACRLIKRPFPHPFKNDAIFYFHDSDA